MFLPGAVVAGRYRVVREIGRGGAWVIYLAERVGASYPVALKVLDDQLVDDPGFMALLAHEARLLARFRHRGIVRLYESGLVGHPAYLAVEYIQGERLDHLLRQRRLSPREVAAIGAQVADALHYAGLRHVVHRDLKPASILVGADGRAVLSDLGIASLAAMVRRSGWARGGSVRFMSPEQAETGRVDGRATCYTLGASMLEMLAGQADFPSATGGRSGGPSGQPLPVEEIAPEVPLWLRRILATCLAREPRQRFSGPGQLAWALRAGTRYSATRGGKRSRGLPLALAGGIGALALGLALFSSSRSAPTTAFRAGIEPPGAAAAQASPASGGPPAAAQSTPVPSATTPTPSPTPSLSDANFSLSLNVSPAPAPGKFTTVAVRAHYLGKLLHPGAITVNFPKGITLLGGMADPPGEVRRRLPGASLPAPGTGAPMPVTAPSIQARYPNSWGAGATHELRATFGVLEGQPELVLLVRAGLDLGLGGPLFPTSGPRDDQGFYAIPWPIRLAS